MRTAYEIYLTTLPRLRWHYTEADNPPFHIQGVKQTPIQGSLVQLWDTLITFLPRAQGFLFPWSIGLVSWKFPSAVVVVPLMVSPERPVSTTAQMLSAVWELPICTTLDGTFVLNVNINLIDFSLRTYTWPYRSVVKFIAVSWRKETGREGDPHKSLTESALFFSTFIFSVFSSFYKWSEKVPRITQPAMNDIYSSCSH